MKNIIFIVLRLTYNISSLDAYAWKSVAPFESWRRLGRDTFSTRSKNIRLPTKTNTRSNGYTDKSGATQSDTVLECGESPNYMSNIIIHWRGEKENGNSLQFRHKEFTCALLATMNTVGQLQTSARKEHDYQPEQCENVLDTRQSRSNDSDNVSFRPALSLDFNGAREMSNYQKYSFENAMQYVDISGIDVLTKTEIIQTARRCSLVRSVFEILAQGETYEELAKNALESYRLQDMMKGGTNSQVSWRVRMRQYGGQAKTVKQKQYGKKMRSPIQAERDAILQMGELFGQFTGPVDLKNAAVSLYILEGLAPSNNDTSSSQPKVLARLLTRGATTSSIAPKTRICVTNTPLCPLAAFTMCNVATIGPNCKILDPFCGSCAILLAATMIEPTVQTVGIDIAHDGQVNRTDILSDFSCRNLTLPTALIRGNSMLDNIRKEARAAIGDEPFDAIITDPPYGIREKSGYCIESPIVDLVNCIGKDRNAIDDDSRLLKIGGKLIVFVPDHEGDNDDDSNISKFLPSDEQLSFAGLKFVDKLKQPLNDSLSRWLIEYQCIS